MKQVNKTYDSTIQALRTLVNQGNINLVKHLVNQPSNSSLINYLNSTGRSKFAGFLEKFVDKKPVKSFEREM